MHGFSGVLVSGGAGFIGSYIADRFSLTVSDSYMLVQLLLGL